MGPMGPGSMGAGRTETPTPTPTPKRYPALKGQRIFDAVSYRRNGKNALILDDVRRIEIGEDELGQFSDDGKTLGDAEANDGVYSQILPPSTNDYIGGTTNFYLQRIITMLRSTESLDPLDFFGLQALTTDRFSSIPNLRDKLQEQMGKIATFDKDQNMSGWSETFLRVFHVDQNDPNSRFFPLYVPRYPEPPSVPPLPAPWKPYGHPDFAQIQMNPMGGGGGSMMGPSGMGAGMGGGAGYVNRARTAARSSGRSGGGGGGMGGSMPSR